MNRLLPLALLSLFACRSEWKLDTNVPLPDCIYFADGDGDGFGDAAEPVQGWCSEAPHGAVGDDTDCDDRDAAIHPAATESCNGIDDNCDLDVDEGLLGDWYADVDADGYGDPDVSEIGCEPGSGWVADDSDCDDTAPAVNPGADEACNERDDDCDGDVDEDLDVPWYLDADGDGFGDAASSILGCEAPAGWVVDPTDCDDGNPAIHPDADERCNGVDDDCDGAIDDADPDVSDRDSWYLDADVDGYGLETSAVQACEQPLGYAALGGDCDDDDPRYNPGAAETDCNDPNDYNCDGSVSYADVDGDGYAACEECDDRDVTVNPGATELCDTVDNDCDGAVDEPDADDASTWFGDGDGDGFGDAGTTVVACSQPSGFAGDDTDCDDGDAAVNPGATELCDGVDNDCDASVDEDSSADAPTWYADVDGDGYGDAGVATVSCGAPTGFTADATDCDDGEAGANPGAAELCDGVDNDCNGAVDEDTAIDATTWYIDNDGDGYGDGAVTTVSCTGPSGYVANATDCDDGDAAVNAGAAELCDGVDNDCDGTVDEASAADAATWYADNDGDGYGDASVASSACSQPSGTVADSADCDDDAVAVNPLATELCDGVDNDCDGSMDEDAAVDASTWYADADGDGYGDAALSSISCAAPSGYGADDTDCDDTDASIHRAASELCDGVDNDCDGTVDEASAVDAGTWYADGDGDGYGDPSVSSSACTAPSGTTADGSDCDDGDAAVNPAASESCDGVDNDCDGTVDEDSAVDAATWYADTDGDGYGDAGATTTACDEPSIYLPSASPADCDDGDAAVYPGASERCNGVDDDCDGSVDEDSAVDVATWYLDADGDGHGDAGDTVVSCSAPSSYVADAADCDDDQPSVHPGATELCDGVDNDCDGALSAAEADADGDGYDLCGDQDCDDGDAAVGPDGDSDGDGGVDCWDEDDDGDGVYDTDELDGSFSGFVTDPLDADTDGDGTDDGDDPAPLTDACASTLYFYDDFTGDPSATWTDISGAWSWDGSDVLACTDTTAGANTWIGSESWSDYVVEVVMRPDSGSNDPGVMTRAQSVSASNDGGYSYYVGLYPDSDSVVLGYQNGGWNVVDSAGATINSGTWYTLQHRMSGSAHEVWLDGSLLISANDSTYSWGSVGFRTYRSPASYDYVLVCD